MLQNLLFYCIVYENSHEKPLVFWTWNAYCVSHKCINYKSCELFITNKPSLFSFADVSYQNHGFSFPCFTKVKLYLPLYKRKKVVWLCETTTPQHTLWVSYVYTWYQTFWHRCLNCKYIPSIALKSQIALQWIVIWLSFRGSLA